MAQTDSVPSSSRQLITGESANQSTTRRALKLPAVKIKPSDRRYFIGGSDARIIMGDDEAALLRLWREKRGEVEPEDLSGNLVVQLGVTTERLNRRWYQANTGQILTDVQRQIRHPVLRWMAAALDGRVEATGAQRAIAVSRAFWSGDVAWSRDSDGGESSPCDDVVGLTLGTIGILGCRRQLLYHSVATPCAANAVRMRSCWLESIKVRSLSTKREPLTLRRIAAQLANTGSCTPRPRSVRLAT